MDADNASDPSLEAIDAFIARWEGANGSERANYQLFLTELCALLGLPQPDPARADTQDTDAYCFEHRVIFQHGDGTQSQGFIDLYRRACYVLECKQTGLTLDTGGWDKAMLRAHGQAVQYVRALPAGEGRPPFVVVVDVGRSIELYSEFSRSGGAYIPYPDPRAHRIRLRDLHDPEIRARLRALWLDPLSLDPSRRAARVTRDIATRLARLAVSLEQAGHPAELAAAFLIRCLFTLFAEDVGLLKSAGFSDLLASVRQDPPQFVPLTEGLWRDMNSGAAFSLVLRAPVLRFNGGLFREAQALPLDQAQIDLLIDAGRADWRHVEPAIFGTLLERALDPLERHKLGAHYTPRAYVERLVLPTVIEPLREEWTAVHSAAFALHEQGKDFDAIKLVAGFQVRLANVRVLDPACGSGNFLYVTLEHLKRLEGEVLDTLERLGQTPDAHGPGRGQRRSPPVTRPGAQPQGRHHRRDGPVDRLPAMALPHSGGPASPRADHSRLQEHPMPGCRACLRCGGVGHRRPGPPRHPLGWADHQAPPRHRRARPRRSRPGPSGALRQSSAGGVAGGGFRGGESAVYRHQAHAPGPG